MPRYNPPLDIDLILISSSLFSSILLSYLSNPVDHIQHNTESDCWLIIGNEKNGGPKVYDVTKYLDDHPGGAEVMMEFAGKDADNMFEDIGHSKEARTTMQKWVIGKLKGGVPKPTNNKTEKERIAEIKSKGGLNPFVILVVILAIVAGLYFSQQKK